MRAFAVTLTMLGLAACSSDPHLMNTSAGRSSPDEFAILPTKPLSMPPDLHTLPTPTPGGPNITDPTPESDAIAALGGNPGQLTVRGVGAADGALVNHASRFGRDPAIRVITLQEDLDWRSRHSRRALEILAGTDVYYRAYEAMTLDSWAEQERWRPTGVQLPAAPPRLESGGLSPEAQETADRLANQ
ncbi:DUF3035 domain-containing protein [Paracoccus aestuariivivens]|uniref:DUF3035 domain-containing protein n=1 Tax=Paracoccus aestuariivivens TaxID=1820333 RepID=A0A6L6JBY8_9RHOB|nr:DUF3035 domain-containing protein [Paracoccus aestuariivivens]MTH78147.1 DUF3035 domain-containing protein [Paracoccus aestuariivivens]